MKIAENGRSGRRHPLAGNPVIHRQKAFQQQYRRRGGHGQHPVRGSYPAAPEGQRADAPRRNSVHVFLGCDQPAGGDNVCDRIHRSDLVERDRVDSDAVYTSLSLREQGKNAERMLSRGRWQRCHLEPRPDVRPSGVRMGMVMLLFVGRNVKARARQRGVAVT